MKKMIVILVAVLSMAVGFCSLASATPKRVDDAIPSCDGSGKVTIPALPAGATLLNVMIFDDVNGTKPKSLGAVSSFKLEPGQGFNFTWKDTGGTWWQMITPQSVADGLVTDCSENGCKYLFPTK